MNVMNSLFSFTHAVDLFERQRDPGFTITCVEIKILRRVHGHVIAEK